MATEADVLRSISTIMEGGLRREEAKVQTALSMMQFAQQQRMQEIALTQSNLELVSKSVQQQKPQVASEFLSSSGLAGIYQQGEEGEPAMDAIEDMAKTLRSKQYFGRKFDTNQAQSMAAAVWNYYSAEDPNAVLKLAGDLHDASLMANDPNQASLMSGQQKKLYEAFAKLHKSSDLTSLTESAKKARQAEAQISKEIFDFTKGDYDISDLSGIYEGIPEALQELEIQRDLAEVPPPAKEIEMEDTIGALQQAEAKYSALQKKMDTGMATDEEKEQYLKIPDLIAEYQQTIGGSIDSLEQQSSSEMHEIDRQLESMRNQGLASSRQYNELKWKKRMRGINLKQLRHKKAVESRRKEKFEQIEDISTSLGITESEAKKMQESAESVTWQEDQIYPDIGF